MHKKYHDQITKNTQNLNIYQKKFNKVGYAKLTFILTLILNISLTYLYKNTFLLVSSITNFAVLIYLWIYHENLNNKLDYYKLLIHFNQQYLKRLSAEWTNFTDIGKEFIDYNHPYASDLDIIGNKSLFQLLNITNTQHGRKRFANDLLSSNYTPKEITLRQSAIKELSIDIEFKNHFQYYSNKIKPNNKIENVLNTLSNKELFHKSKFIKTILLFFPLITFTYLIAIVTLGLEPLYKYSILFLIIQMITWVLGKKKTSAYLKSISHLPNILNNYSLLFKTIKSKDYTSKKLQQIQEDLVTSNVSAVKAMKDLEKIADKINIVNEGLFNLFLNILFLWDYRNAIQLELWKQKYGEDIHNWFNTLGEFESLLSFSNLPNICNHVTIPTISNTPNILNGKDIGHPLIPNNLRVNNDILLDDSIHIISGSNMSGKTTFMRSLGINLVLAQAGSFVCANHLEFSKLKLITSMRIADNLNEGISTFYAELKRIKKVIDTGKEYNNTLFLIDEIFRGTNSKDRLYGSQTVVSQLNTFNNIGMITTHDLELSYLASHNQRIKNFHFKEYYSNNKIEFDYIIHTGVSTTTNAKHLLKMVGITE